MENAHIGSNEWPMTGLDVPALIEGGWRPTPFRQFVVKLHARCNLACDYCYMYRMADQSWRATPREMSTLVVRRTAERIAEHVLAHGLTRVEVILHGGEPLLVGGAAVAEAARTLGRDLPLGTALSCVVQTNGVLLDEPTLDALATADIRVCVSLDGDPETHDRWRPLPNGQGSHAAVARGLALLDRPAYRRLFAGLLCVVDVDADPVRAYECLLEFGPPAVDFLLPHANWSRPPRYHGEAARYGHWLAAVFDRWYAAPRRETEVRLFQEILNLALGGRSRTEQIGLSPAAMVVISTDGSLEQVDTLRSAYDRGAETGLSVFTHDLDAALRHPAVVARQIGAAALSGTCRPCRVRRVCGGGHYVHRYRAGAGFLNPSVYCADLRLLIDHIAARLGRDLADLRGRRP